MSYTQSLLLALSQVGDAAHRVGKPVAVCGEIAGDPARWLLLLGMGFGRLSMSAAALPPAKWALRSTSSTPLRELFREALSCERPDAVRRLIVTVRLDSGFGPRIPQSPPSLGRPDFPRHRVTAAVG